MQKTNLLDLNLPQLQDLMLKWGEPHFRGLQIFKWIHQHGLDNFDAMTNLSKSLRQRLTDEATIQPPSIGQEQISNDGTRKWLIKLSCGNSVETVFIPEAGRGTLCVSSQVGCALNCSFCSTARQGFNRNLSVAEIIGQVWLAARQLSQQNGTHDRHVTNIVMMGMGEPLLNYDNVVTAMDIMLDDNAYGLAKRRVTLSTSGVVPAMYELAKRTSAALAVSLHAPNDELRNELVPINKKYPINELLAACRTFFPDEPKRHVTYEYVMLKGINDRPHHAKQLIKLLQGMSAKVNLIPFNPFPNANHQCTPQAEIDQFQEILTKAGINTIMRKTRGDDIDAACGQLVGKVADRTKRSARYRAAVVAGLDCEV